MMWRFYGQFAAAYGTCWLGFLFSMIAFDLDLHVAFNVAFFWAPAIALAYAILERVMAAAVRENAMVRIDTSRITGWDSFHDVFKEAMGFPGFYGRNMDAWIDCMTSVDEPKAGMTRVCAPRGGVVTLSLSDATDLASRCPEIHDAIVECSAFVNYRCVERGRQAVLALAFRRHTG